MRNTLLELARAFKANAKKFAGARTDCWTIRVVAERNTLSTLLVRILQSLGCVHVPHRNRARVRCCGEALRRVVELGEAREKDLVPLLARLLSSSPRSPGQASPPPRTQTQTAP